MNSAFLFVKSDIVSELRALIAQGKSFDQLILALDEVGFNLPAKYLVKFVDYAPKLLDEGGTMAIIGKAVALTLTNPGLGQDIKIRTFSPVDSLFTRFPSMISKVKDQLPEFIYLSEETVNLSFRHNLLRMSAPALTPAGQVRRNRANEADPEEYCLLGIDGHRQVSTIINVMKDTKGITESDALKLLRSLESKKQIFPLTSRVDFLASCYEKKTPVRLGRLMVASGLLSESQLIALLEIQADLQETQGIRKLLGTLALEYGYLSEIYLSQLLQDQTVFSEQMNPRQHGTSDGTAIARQQKQDSLFGSLATMDQSVLTQSIASSKLTGILFVEGEKGNFTLVFDDGTPVAARLNKLKGKEALLEFMSIWNEGLFSFHNQAIDKYLNADCLLKYPLSRALMDAALIADISQKIISSLPQNEETIFERVWNFEESFAVASKEPIILADETTVKPVAVPLIAELSLYFDGLSSIREIVINAQHLPRHTILQYMDWMQQKSLLILPDDELSSMIDSLRQEINEVSTTLGGEDAFNLLEMSKELSIDGSQMADILQVRPATGPYLDHTKLRQFGLPVSLVAKAIKTWRSTYIACLRRVDKDLSDKLEARSRQE